MLDRWVSDSRCAPGQAHGRRYFALFARLVQSSEPWLQRQCHAISYENNLNPASCVIHRDEGQAKNIKLAFSKYNL